LVRYRQRAIAPQNTRITGTQKESYHMVATFKNIAARFVREEEGATLVEYVLLVALIGVVAITAMRFLGGTAANKLNNVAGNVANSN
jgi:pilus assembly protein Flp/PilA